jgi:putative flavoprotein involved in K+ transport
MTTHVETVIVGGGQAGLAVRHYLKRQNRPHMVMEQAEKPANAWRNHRWDSFTLNTPNWQSGLPGVEIPGSNPNGFRSREEIVAYLESYVSRFQLPVSYGVQVQTVIPKYSGRGYVLETSAGRFEAINIVIATGFYQKPKMPALSADFPREIKQIHFDEYRNPQSLPDGAVLVVGLRTDDGQLVSPSTTAAPDART